jgi:hypothetical protein
MCRDLRRLGAKGLSDGEIKGTNSFAKSAFHKREGAGFSRLLQAAEGTLAAIPKYHGYAFVIWTTHPDLLTLRHAGTTKVAKPYKELLFDFRALMENEAPGHLDRSRETLAFGSNPRFDQLNFDLRGTRADETTAAAIQNYMVRTRGGWERHFLCVPNFTVSSVSPGLQAADVIAYLGARLTPGQDRPELQPYIDRMRGLTYQFTRPGRSARRTRTARRVS